MGTKALDRKVSRRPGRFVPNLDPLEERHLFSHLPEPSPLSLPFARTVEVAPAADGPRARGHWTGLSGGGPRAASPPENARSMGRSTGDRHPGAFDDSWSIVPLIDRPARGSPPGDRLGPTPGADQSRSRVTPSVVRVSTTAPDRPGPAASRAPVDVEPPGVLARVAAEAEPLLILVPVGVEDSAVTGPVVGIDEGQPGLPPPTAAQAGSRQAQAGPPSPVPPPSRPFQGPQAEPLPEVPEDEGEGPPPTGSVSERTATREVPPPRGSDLITEFTPFDRAALEESLSRLLDRLEGLGKPLRAQARPLSYLPIVAALVVLEVARRWHKRRSESGSTRPWGARRPGFRGLS
jgi:hypothetical protein